MPSVATVASGMAARSPHHALLLAQPVKSCLYCRSAGGTSRCTWTPPTQVGAASCAQGRFGLLSASIPLLFCCAFCCGQPVLLSYRCIAADHSQPAVVSQHIM